jgi:ATP-dependent Lon protease
VIIAPQDNKKDLDDIPTEVKRDVKFVFVEEVEDALKIALSEWPIKVNKATKFTSMSESLMVN